MTDAILNLVLSSALFVGAHLFISHPPIRAPLRKTLGKWGFRAGYSLLSGAAFTWMIYSFGNAPRTMLWEAPIFVMHGSLTLMLIAVFLIICGATTPNPGIMDMEKQGLALGPSGVLKITRHPVMWGIALFGTSHILANGHLEGLIFFGSLVVLALAGASHIDYRKAQRLGDQWHKYVSITSHVPMAAIISGRSKVESGEIKWWQTLLTILVFSGFLIGHENMFGPYVMPM
jgi:uncharacterized membrane protein